MRSVQNQWQPVQVAQGVGTRKGSRSHLQRAFSIATSATGTAGLRACVLAPCARAWGTYARLHMHTLGTPRAPGAFKSICIGVASCGLDPSSLYALHARCALSNLEVRSGSGNVLEHPEHTSPPLQQPASSDWGCGFPSCCTQAHAALTPALGRTVVVVAA